MIIHFVYRYNKGALHPCKYILYTIYIYTNSIYCYTIHYIAQVENGTNFMQVFTSPYMVYNEYQSGFKKKTIPTQN